MRRKKPRRASVPIQRIVRSYYNRDAKDYRSRFGKPAQHLELFARHLPPNARVLDAGCGPGVNLEWLRNQGHRVIGVDLSQKMLKTALRFNSGERVAQMDLQQLGFKNSRFDGIVAAFSLIHIPRENLSRALNEFSRVLTPKGIAHVSFQEGKGGERFVKRTSDPHSVYMNVLSRSQSQNALKNAGFEIVATFVRKPRRGEWPFDKRTWLVRKARRPTRTPRVKKTSKSLQ